MTGAAGIALGLSATVAQVGEVLLLPAVVYALAAGGGWRRALGRAGLLCVAFALPILVYMGIAASVTGHFRLSNTGTGGLYGRAAAAADCATLRVPASQRAMCPTAAQKAALGDDGLLHSPVSPVRRYYAELPPAEASHTVSAFTRAVFTQQPLRVASAIASGCREAVRRAPGDQSGRHADLALAVPGLLPLLLAARHAARGQRGDRAVRRRRARGHRAAGQVPARLPAGRRLHSRAAVRDRRAGRPDRLAEPGRPAPRRTPRP